MKILLGVLLIILISTHSFAGELAVFNYSETPIILVINGQKVSVYALQRGSLVYSGFSVKVSMYDVNGNFIDEKKIETPHGRAILLISTSQDGKLILNLVTPFIP